MSGRLVLVAWLAFIVIAYALTLMFVTPPTGEAKLGTTVLFVLCGAQLTCAGMIGWARR